MKIFGIFCDCFSIIVIAYLVIFYVITNTTPVNGFAWGFALMWSIRHLYRRIWERDKDFL